jgi:hypothetical protein
MEVLRCTSHARVHGRVVRKVFSSDNLPACIKVNERGYREPRKDPFSAVVASCSGTKNVESRNVQYSELVPTLQVTPQYHVEYVQQSGA